MVRVGRGALALEGESRMESDVWSALLLLCFFAT